MCKGFLLTWEMVGLFPKGISVDLNKTHHVLKIKSLFAIEEDAIVFAGSLVWRLYRDFE